MAPSTKEITPIPRAKGVTRENRGRMQGNQSKIAALGMVPIQSKREVGRPSYTSGTQRWVGNRPSLKETVSNRSSCGQIAKEGSMKGRAANRSSK